MRHMPSNLIKTSFQYTTYVFFHLAWPLSDLENGCSAGSDLGDGLWVLLLIGRPINSIKTKGMPPVCTQMPYTKSPV